MVMRNDLLLIACSASKRQLPVTPIPAIERYDGVFVRVLRKWLRHRKPMVAPDVLIISSRFGLIEGTTPISNYDERMTARRAEELAPTVRSVLRTHLRQKNYRRTFVNVGRDYLATFAGVDELKHASWASGGIGQRAQQMKRWLEASRAKLTPWRQIQIGTI